MCVLYFVCISNSSVRKILNVRIWDDENGKRWQYSVSQRKYEVYLSCIAVDQFILQPISSECNNNTVLTLIIILQILCVSQFTLYHVLKGNSPDFHNAMASSESKEFFEKFVSKLKASYDSNLVKGKFSNVTYRKI